MYFILEMWMYISLEDLSCESFVICIVGFMKIILKE